MKKTALFTVALLGMSALSASAFAQSKPLVPGSDASKAYKNEQTRNSVAEQPGTATDATPVNPSEETMVPGNTKQIRNKEADERNAIAAGTDAETTNDAGNMTPAGSEDNNPTGSPDDSGSVKTNSPMEMQKATPSTGTN